MALKSSSVYDLSTSPRSTHLYFGFVRSSVSLVASAIPDVFFPNAENA